MKQNQKSRYNGRYNNNKNQRFNLTRNTAMDSSGPCGKLHGTALQLFERYTSSAKDALIQNDLILAESCMQHADHYIRLQNIAIANEQAMRPVNPQQTMPVMSSAMPSVPDELPVVALPEEEKIQPVTKETETDESEEASKIQDEALSRMDLSVPVRAIEEKHKNQNQKQQKQQQPSQHKTRKPVGIKEDVASPTKTRKPISVKEEISNPTA